MKSFTTAKAKNAYQMEDDADDECGLIIAKCSLEKQAAVALVKGASLFPRTACLESF